MGTTTRTLWTPTTSQLKEDVTKSFATHTETYDTTAQAGPSNWQERFSGVRDRHGQYIRPGQSPPAASSTERKPYVERRCFQNPFSTRLEDEFTRIPKNSVLYDQTLPSPRQPVPLQPPANPLENLERKQKKKPRPSATDLAGHLKRSAGERTGLADIVGETALPSTTQHLFGSPRDEPPHRDAGSSNSYYKLARLSPLASDPEESEGEYQSQLHSQKDSNRSHQLKQSHRTTSRHSAAAPPEGPPPETPGKPGKDDPSDNSSGDEEPPDNAPIRRHHRHRQVGPGGPGGNGPPGGHRGGGGGGGGRGGNVPDPQGQAGAVAPQRPFAPAPLHVDPKLKISDLPEFDGDDDNILDYMGKVNMIAEESQIVQSQLGRLLPLCFTERASSWYQSLPLIDCQVMINSWATLKAALMTHFMNPAWCAAKIAKANRIRFHDRGHENEKPVDYVVRKKLHLTLLRTWEFDPLIWEILQGAPQQWGVILRTDDLGGQWTEFINRVQQHSDALINARSDGKGNSQLEHRLERLERKLSHHSNSHFSKPSKFKKSDKKGKGKAKSHLVGSSPGLPKPRFSPQKFKSKVRTRPSQTKPNLSRPCKHCGGDHWDDECCKSRQNSLEAKAQMASASPEDLAAQDEYNELYAAQSSCDESSEGNSKTDSEPEEEESDSDSSQEDFESPSNVLSSTVSSEMPFAETEKSIDVLEGQSEGQVNTGIAIVSTALVTPVHPTLPSVPTRRALAKSYKLQASRGSKDFTTTGSKVILRQLTLRPPGRAWMGTIASIVEGRIGGSKGKVHSITFDLGSDCYVTHTS
ncbi:hypothetical protein FS749_002944 [Ceratobasidium sp. UAMH 11750]|nr:hypothetical protein FS749_002944 [Ceratobasidium sp. UAMH 11750]